MTEFLSNTPVQYMHTHPPPPYEKYKFRTIYLFLFFTFWRWDLARLVSFILSGTPRQGVKTACSGLPGSITDKLLLESLSEETFRVETTQALSQTPLIFTHHAS
jgi:hypothetical protein